jgi:hypothetical protein
MSKKILFNLFFILLIYCNSFSQILINQSKPLASLCTDVVLSNNSQIAYITNINGELMFIDLTTMNITKTLKEHEGFIKSLVIDNKNRLYTAGGDKMIIQWDATTGNVINKIHTPHFNKINDIAISKNGKFLATASEDKSVLVYWADSLVFYKKIIPNSSAVACVSISPYNEWIVSGGWDYKIVFTSLKNDNSFIMDGHKGAVLDIDFTPDGKYLLSGSDDHTAMLWDVENRKAIATFKTNGSVNNVECFFDNRYAAVADMAGYIYIININKKEKVTEKKIVNGSIESIYLSYPTGWLGVVGGDKKLYIYNMNQFILDSCYSANIREFDSLAAPKQLMETEQQYIARQKQFLARQLAVLNKCYTQATRIRLAQDRTADTLFAMKYHEVQIPIEDIGKYDDKNFILPIKVNGQWYEARIPVQDAQTLISNFKKATVLAINRPVVDDNPNEPIYQLINLRLKHPISNKIYPIGQQITPAEDKYLRIYLQLQTKTKTN